MDALSPSRIRYWLAGAARAMLIGIALSSFYAIANWPKGFGVTLFIGAVIGVVDYACISAVYFSCRTMLSRLQPRARTIILALLIALAGAFGAILGLVAAVNLAGGHMRIGEVLGGRGTPFVLVTTVIALISVVLFRAFEHLRQRVRETAWAERELEMAREIQTRLLPAAELDGDGFRLTARNLAAAFVAGDFYDFVRNDDGTITIVVADVAGKGMGASLIMASVKAVLPFVAREDVAESMRLLNAKLVTELAKREFVALVCARFDPAARTITIANAGCPDPYLVRGRTARAVEVGGIRLPLGMRANIDYETTTLALQGGDRLLFFSDGMPEALLPNGEPLGYDELARLVVESGGELDALIAAVRRETAPKLADDWTAIALAISPST